MSNLALSKTDFDRLVKAAAYLAAILCFSTFVLLIFVFGSDATTAILRAIASTPPLVSLVVFLFCRFAWKMPWIARLMGKPIVFGLWKGTLFSNYDCEEGEYREIPIYFVIRQSYLTVSIVSYTANQEGESTLESLTQHERTERKQLRYVYELRTPYQSTSDLVRGTGELTLTGEAANLRGSYWTDTPTHGELTLQRVTHDCDGVDSFEDAVRRAGEASKTK